MHRIGVSQCPDVGAPSPGDAAGADEGGADRDGLRDGRPRMPLRPHPTRKEKSHMEPFFREAGTGPGVVCLHSNASTSGQWRGLMDLLAPRFRVFAPDSYDAGKSPHWPSDRVIHLRDEVGLIEPVLTRAGSPLALVGHSYGAAVALIAALIDRSRVRAMALYEPTLFALLGAEVPAPNEAEGIRNVIAEAGIALTQETKTLRPSDSLTTGWYPGPGPGLPSNASCPSRRR